MRKIAFLVIISCIACCAVSFGQEAKSGPVVQAGGSIYSYTDSDTPQVFFFPKDKARWDGTKVTMREWYLLTNLQKEKFVTEYIGQLENQYKQSINVMGLDYLEALNVFSYYSNGPAMEESPTRFIDRLLDGQRKLPAGGNISELFNKSN